jgi:hypothetical protein
MVDTVDSKSIAKSVEVQILSRARSCCTFLNVINGVQSDKELLLSTISFVCNKQNKQPDYILVQGFTEDFHFACKMMGFSATS